MNRLFDPLSSPHCGIAASRRSRTPTSKSAAPPAFTCSARQRARRARRRGRSVASATRRCSALRLGVTFTDMFGIEGEFGVIPSESRSLVFDVWNVTYRAHVIAQFGAAKPAKKLIPFVLARRRRDVDRRHARCRTSIEKDTDAALRRRRREVSRRQRLGPARRLRACCSRRAPTSNGPTVGLRGAAVDLQGVRPQGRREGRRAADRPKRHRRRRHHGRQRQVPERARGQGRLPGRRRLPRSATTTATASPTRTTSARTRPRTRTASRTTTAAPNPDNDKDGIPDAADKCPNEAEDKDGFQDDDGCPDPDNDGDGVPDAQRQVPGPAGDQERLPGRGRLPRRDPAEVKQFTGVIQGINFKVELGGPAAGVEQDARQGRRGAQGVPGPQARDPGPHRRPAAQGQRQVRRQHRRCRRRAPRP